MGEIREQTHLDPEELASFLSQDLTEDLTPEEKRRIEQHLDQCADCVSTLASVQKLNQGTDVPETADEAAALAAIETARGPTPAEIRARAAGNKRENEGDTGFESEPFSRRELALAAAAILVAFGLAHFLYNGILKGRLPTVSKPNPLELLADARQGTGRIPMRYIRTFERANITRSGFDEDPELGPIIGLAREQAEGETNTESMLILGLVLLDTGSLDEAERWLERARERAPRDADVLNGLAVLNYARAERLPADSLLYHQRGLVFLRDAEQWNPNDRQVLYNYGVFYEAMESPEAAVAAWKRYLELDDETEWAAEATARLNLLEPEPEISPDEDGEPAGVNGTTTSPPGDNR